MKALTELERRCQTLREEVEHLSEKLQALADLMLSEKDMQKKHLKSIKRRSSRNSRSWRSKGQGKLWRSCKKEHMLIKCEGERERARIMQRLEASSATGPWSGGHDNSSFGFLARPHTDEAMSASSRMVQEVDEATSETSWTALAKGKERDWWSIDLEGEVEKLEVSGPWFGTKDDSVEPKEEMGHKSDRAKVTKRGRGQVEGR